MVQTLSRCSLCRQLQEHVCDGCHGMQQLQHGACASQCGCLRSLANPAHARCLHNKVDKLTVICMRGRCLSQMAHKNNSTTDFLSRSDLYVGKHTPEINRMLWVSHLSNAGLLHCSIIHTSTTGPCRNLLLTISEGFLMHSRHRSVCIRLGGSPWPRMGVQTDVKTKP